MRAALEPYYWRFQLLGWALFCGLDLFSGYFLFEGALVYYTLDFSTQWASYVLASHLILQWTDYRGWLRLSAARLWMRVTPACLLLGMLCAAPGILFYQYAEALMPAAMIDLLALVDATDLPLLFVANSTGAATKLIFWYLVVWVIYLQQVGTRQLAQQHTLQLELQSAQLDQLRQQLKPHFLFNCLNSIRAMIHIDKDQSSEMVGELTHLLRYTLQAPGDRVTLAEELRAVDSYLNLEQVRLGERLKVVTRIAPDTLEFRLPPLVLQTLVENAIKHGISRRINGGLVEIQAQSDESGLNLSIQNDGDLNDRATGLGIGLKNSRRRLKLLYGRDDLLQIVQQGHAVLARLHIPAAVPPARAHG